jgi:hypothetical protein
MSSEDISVKESVAEFVLKVERFGLIAVEDLQVHRMLRK